MTDTSTTHADQASSSDHDGTSLLAWPRALGVAPLPAGSLLSPVGHDEAQALLVAARRRATFPIELGSYGRSIDGDVDGAAARGLA
jgi:hypothetical protein